MSVFYNIIDEIELNLSQDPNLSDIKFINSDVGDIVPNPLRKVHVSIGICNVEIKTGAFNSYLGMGEKGEQYGNNADINMELKIFSPRELGSKECYTVFSRIYEQLLYNEKNYNIKSISCGKTQYNTDIFSFELSCNILLNAFIGYETDDINISTIKVEKRT